MPADLGATPRAASEKNRRRPRLTLDADPPAGRALCRSTVWSPRWWCRPTQDEVAQLVAACAGRRARMVPWAGARLSGWARPVRPEVAVNSTDLERIVELDAANLA